MTRRSLHLGVDTPDPAHYGTAVRSLTGAEADARAWHALAGTLGYDAGVPLVGRAATTTALGEWVDRAVADGVPEVLVTWSGHGTQVPRPAGLPGYDEPDGLDETWVTWDRMLLDDEVHALMARFAAGTRVVLVVDSCHSFGSFRVDAGPDAPVPRRVLERRSLRVVTAHQDLYDAVRLATPPAPPVAATVLGLAACAEAEVALESRGRGHFTAALTDLVAGGFDGTYAELVAAAATRTSGQHPRAFWYSTSSGLLRSPAFPRALLRD